MMEEEKKVYICDMLLEEDRESYISNGIAAFPEVDRVELEKLADKEWGPSSNQAKKPYIPSATDFLDSMFNIAGLETSRGHKEEHV